MIQVVCFLSEHIHKNWFVFYHKRQRFPADFPLNKFREYDCKRKISVNECAASRILSIVYSVALRWSAMFDVFFAFVSDVSHARVWGDSDGKICGFEVIKHDKTLDFFTFFFDVNQVALCLNLQNTSKYAALRRWAAFKWHRWDFAKRGVCRRLLMFFWVSWKGCNEQNKYIIIIAYVIWYYIKIIGTLGFQSNYSGFWSFVLSRNVKFVFFFAPVIAKSLTGEHFHLNINMSKACLLTTEGFCSKLDSLLHAMNHARFQFS